MQLCITGTVIIFNSLSSLYKICKEVKIKDYVIIVIYVRSI